MDVLSFITIIASLLVPSFPSSMAVDSILRSNFKMSDGIALVSKGGSFKLGFFSPGNSKKRYLGIWYKDIPIQTVVWVANRVSPINDSSASASASTILTLNSTGSLVLTLNDSIIWCSTSLKQVQNPVAELLDSRNLVVRDENEDNPKAYLWQSFDYPTDTFLPEMKLGYDLRMGMNRRLTAWKAPDDPSPGDFSLTIFPRDYPEFYMMKGDSKFFITGPWNGVGFSGWPELKQNVIFYYGFVSTKKRSTIGTHSRIVL